MEISEHFLCPQINSTFPRIKLAEDGDGNRLWNEKEAEGHPPVSDSMPPFFRDQWHGVDVDDRNHEHERQIEQPKLAMQSRNSSAFAVSANYSGRFCFTVHPAPSAGLELILGMLRD